MNKILVLLILCVSFSARAETVRWRQDANGSIQFIILHQEGARYFVDTFRKKPGEMQERVSSVSFDDRSTAKESFANLSSDYREQKPLSIRSVKNEFVTEVTTQNVWRAKNAWSDTWEKKYSAWINETAGPNYLLDNGVATDCADVAVALRWIFARINFLPAADHLGGSGALVTNESVRNVWLGLPTAERWQEDQRFRAALDYILENTYTHSLMEDLYPVKINAASIVPGTIFLHLYSAETGHTEFLRLVDPSEPEPIRVMASDVPREVRALKDYGIQDWGYPPTEGESGLLRFRWPVKWAGYWRLISASGMPDYSLEQYDPGFSDGYGSFVDAVIHKVFPDWQPNYQLFLRSKTLQLLDRLNARVQIVEDGFKYCSSHGGCREGSSAWEAWSTPSRDNAINRVMDSIKRIYYDGACSRACRAELDQHLTDTLTSFAGKPYSVNDAFRAWNKNSFSSDPNDPPENRWGVKP